MRRKELFYYVTSGSNVTRDVHWCVTVDYQQIANGNTANQIHEFTIDYGKFILILDIKRINRYVIRWLRDPYSEKLGHAMFWQCCTRPRNCKALHMINASNVGSTRDLISKKRKTRSITLAVYCLHQAASRQRVQKTFRSEENEMSSASQIGELWA